MWLLSHWHKATAVTFQKMHITGHHWGVGLWNLLGALLATLALWAVLALAAFRSGWWRRPDSPPPTPAWLRPVLVRYLGLIALILLVMLFAANVTVFKDRWVLPMLAPVPLMAFALRPELETDPRGRVFTGLALTLIAGMLIAACVRPWFSALRGGTDELNHPAVQLATLLQNAGYDGQGSIIAADGMLAGTLRTRFPAAPAMACAPRLDDVPECVAQQAQAAERAGRGWLIISRADRLEPDWWTQALSRIPDSNGLPRGNLRLPFRMVPQGHPMASYNFVWHPAQMQPEPPHP
jgi:hypothetical protein